METASSSSSSIPAAGTKTTQDGIRIESISFPGKAKKCVVYASSEDDLDDDDDSRASSPTTAEGSSSDAESDCEGNLQVAFCLHDYHRAHSFCLIEDSTVGEDLEAGLSRSVPTSFESDESMGKKTSRRIDPVEGISNLQEDGAWSSSVVSNKSTLTPRGRKTKNPKAQGARSQPPTTKPPNSGLRIPQPAEEPDTDAVCVPIVDERKPVSPSRSERAQQAARKLMEHAPLLRPLSSIADDPDWEFRYAVESRPDLKTEFLHLCELSYPVIFTYVLEFLPGIISMTLVGHMDSPKTKEYVGGVSLSTMFVNLTAVAFGFGLATAMDTLCSQAYGAGKPKKMGIYLQSGMIVLGCAWIPVFLLNWYTAEFLLMMGQPPEVAMLAGRFSRLVLPGIPFLYVYELFKKLLQAQNVVKPMVYIAVLSNIVNVVVGVYLTFYTSLGYDGAAIARTIANIVLPACLVPYFMWRPAIWREWWSGWKIPAAMNHLRQFLTLGVPGMFMMLLEWWSFEIMAAFVGLLPDSIVAISVHSVLVNISTMAFNFFLGISVAGNIRVGNYVGSNQPEHAKMASYLAMALSLGVSVALALVIIVSRNMLPHVFINDATTVALAAHALLFLMPFQLMDAWNGVMQGVFRGTGRQMLGAYINFFAYFVVGLPFGIYLAFQGHWGVEGMWIGLTAGISVGCFISIYKIHHTNWNEMADAARLRTS